MLHRMAHRTSTQPGDRKLALLKHVAQDQSRAEPMLCLRS
jgi:hypothetical protein